MGLLDGRLANTEGLPSFSRTLSNIRSTNEVHAFRVGVRVCALLAAAVLYAGWCGATSGAGRGLQFGLLMGIFVACIHPISNLITMNMDKKLGLEIAASNAIGWVLAGLVIGLVYKPLTPKIFSS